MSFKPEFLEPAVEYIRRHTDESRSVLAYKVSRLFGYPCTKKGVQGVIRRLKKEEANGASNSA
jgi:hypothetical protein